MNRRIFLGAFLFVPITLAHSPWGQYAVYRQKHLLIMSAKTDPDSYPYSEILIDAINREEPTASARPARARDLNRCHSLVITNQMQFTLLPKESTLQLREGTGSFSDKDPLPIQTMYEFGSLVLSVRTDMDPNIVRIVTYSILEQLESLPLAASPQAMLRMPEIHIDSLTAINTFLSASEEI